MSDQSFDFYGAGYNAGYRGLGADETVRDTAMALGRELTESERAEIERGYDDGADDGLDVGDYDDE